MSTAAVFPSARLRRMLATCLFCVSALGAIVEAQEPGGRILGRVQDLTGMPASGASVTVHVPAELAVRAETHQAIHAGARARRRQVRTPRSLRRAPPKHSLDAI